MASLGAAFLPPEEQKLALTRNLGDALAVVARRLFGRDHATTKMERQWGFDRTTAKNTLKGVVGAVPVTKAVRAQQDREGNGWALWDALGELIIGESRDAYEERMLRKIIEETENARSLADARRARRSALEARTWGDGPLGDGLATQQNGRASEPRSEDDGASQAGPHTIGGAR